MASRQAKHQSKKRMAGICAYGGCNIPTGWDYRCPNHKAKHARKMRAKREAAKQAAQSEAKAA